MINHGSQLRMIAEDLRSKRKPQTSGKSAEATIDLLSAIYKSALTEKPVRRGTIVPGDPFYKAFHGNLPVHHRRMPAHNKASC